MAEYELNAFIEGSGDTGRTPFQLRISEPVKSENAEDWFCTVHAPFLFTKDKRIFGVSGDQARALAIDFVRELLRGKRLVDAHG